MILHILTNIILPVFVMIGVGVWANYAFKPDLTTLSKLNFYVFVPALTFVRLLDSELSGDLIGLVIGFNIIHTIILLAVSWLVFSIKPLRSARAMLTASALFNNCGNYGIPFAQLAFGDFGVQVMAFILVFQNLIMFTIGLWLLGSERTHWKERLLTPLKTPVLYAVVAALLLNTLQVKPPEALHFAMQQLGNGLVPIALLTLGVQLARARWSGQIGIISAALLMRLIASPLLATALAWIWQSIAPMTQSQVFPVLICGAALPVAVNVYIIAAEYHRDAEPASRIIFWSTLASAITLTGWLAIFTQ